MKRFTTVLGLSFVGIGAICCSSGDGGGASSSPGSYTAISDSIAHPTGQLDKSTAGNVATEFEKVASSGAAGRRIQQSQSATETVACPSGGDYTVQVTGSQTSGQANVDYNQCCYEASCCLDGGGVWYFASGGSSEYTYCGTYDIAMNCGTDSGNIKYEGCVGTDGSWTYVVHVSGKTYSVNGTISNGTGTLEITAANGSWTCTYTNYTGTCTGTSGDFTF